MKASAATDHSSRQAPRLAFSKTEPRTASPERPGHERCGAETAGEAADETTERLVPPLEDEEARSPAAMIPAPDIAATSQRGNYPPAANTTERDTISASTPIL